MAKPYGLTRAEEARNKAMAQFAKAKKVETEFWREIGKQRQADLDKTNRLRALRLAKEAADREAALAAPKPPAVRRKSAPKAKPPAPAANDD